MAPGLVETLEGGHEVFGTPPSSPIGDEMPPRNPLHADRGDASTRLQVFDHVPQRRRSTHYIVSEGKQRGIRHKRYLSVLDWRVDQQNVAPSAALYQRSCRGQLLWTLLDTDDSSLGADSVFELGETPASSASYVQDSIASRESKAGYASFTQLEEFLEPSLPNCTTGSSSIVNRPDAF
jgi:hypothetical protein